MLARSLATRAAAASSSCSRRTEAPSTVSKLVLGRPSQPKGSIASMRRYSALSPAPEPAYSGSVPWSISSSASSQSSPSSSPWSSTSSGSRGGCEARDYPLPPWSCGSSAASTSHVYNQRRRLARSLDAQSILSMQACTRGTGAQLVVTAGADLLSQ